MTKFLDQLNSAKQQVRLPLDRKAAVQSALQAYMQELPVKDQQPFFAFIQVVFSRTVVVPVVALLVILSGAATAAASDVSLPGDVLYPVKVNLVEKLKTAWARSDEAQAEADLVLLDRRMDEGVAMATQGDLNEQAQSKLNDLIVKRATQLQAHLDELSNSNQQEKAAELTAKYEAIAIVHSEALKNLPDHVIFNTALQTQLEKAAAVRTRLEQKAAGDQSQVSLINKINAAVNVMAEAQSYIDKKSANSEVSVSSQAAATAKLATAQQTLNQARTELAAGDLAKVNILANQSIRTAQEAKALVRLNYNLNVEVGNNGNSQSHGQGVGNESSHSAASESTLPQRLRNSFLHGLNLEDR